MRKAWEVLLLQFRVLFRQFVLRVIDLESLSIQADIPRFLGQFASILVFISLVGSLGLLMSNGSLRATPEAYLSFVWRGEQALISGTMLVVGLVSVVSWDATFPDRRDVMVLCPLPVSPRMILIAKLAASAALIGLAILTLNFATGLAWPLFIGAHHESAWGFLQSLYAYWFTIFAASGFLICSVLSVQGLTALVLPRRMFLALSAFLQITAFGLVLGIYFLQPSITTAAAMAAPQNHWILTWSPSFWFFALFNQLNGSLPSQFRWLAARAWVSLLLVVAGASTSMLLCYFRTMRKTVEEPDLIPGTRGGHWSPRFGNAIQTTIVLFSLRSIVRSRQHRLAFAFYLAVICSIALSWLRTELLNAAPVPLSAEFMTDTIVMNGFAVFGLRSVFSLPISLNANWMWRTTQLRAPEEYMDATRRTLLVLAVVPVWLIAALLSLPLRPFHQVAGHLVLLALLGWIFAEISLVGFYKIPFTCSYLPGKVHVQVILWSFLILLVVFGMVTAEYEVPTLRAPVRTELTLMLLIVAGTSLWGYNRHLAKSAVLYFEESPPEEITSLGLTWIAPSSAEKKNDRVRKEPQRSGLTPEAD